MKHFLAGALMSGAWHIGSVGRMLYEKRVANCLKEFSCEAMLERATSLALQCSLGAVVHRPGTMMGARSTRGRDLKIEF